MSSFGEPYYKEIPISDFFSISLPTTTSIQPYLNQSKKYSRDRAPQALPQTAFLIFFRLLVDLLGCVEYREKSPFSAFFLHTRFRCLPPRAFNHKLVNWKNIYKVVPFKLYFRLPFVCFSDGWLTYCGRRTARKNSHIFLSSSPCNSAISLHPELRIFSNCTATLCSRTRFSSFSFYTIPSRSSKQAF